MASIDIDPDQVQAGNRRGIDLDPMRVRIEQVALLLVVAVVGQIAQFVLQGFANARSVQGDSLNWTVFLSAATYGGYIVDSVLLAMAFALVVLAPGAVGRLGVVVMNAISVLGVAVATLALVAVEESFRTASSFSRLGVVPDGITTWFDRLAQAGAFLPSALVSGALAYIAWQMLVEGWGVDLQRADDDDLDDSAHLEVEDPGDVVEADDERWAEH